MRRRRTSEVGRRDERIAETSEVARRRAHNSGIGRTQELRERIDSIGRGHFVDVISTSEAYQVALTQHRDHHQAVVVAAAGVATLRRQIDLLEPRRTRWNDEEAAIRGAGRRGEPEIGRPRSVAGLPCHPRGYTRVCYR